jgi:hypothetical protein
VAFVKIELGEAAFALDGLRWGDRFSEGEEREVFQVTGMSLLFSPGPYNHATSLQLEERKRKD